MEEIRNRNGSTRQRSARSDIQTSDRVQDGIRSSGTEGRQTIREARGDGEEYARETRESGWVDRSSKGGDSREGRASTEDDTYNSGVDASNGANNGTVQRNATNGSKLDAKEKPSGFTFKPNAREKQARQEQAKQEQAREASSPTAESKKGLFRFLHSDNRRKQKEPSRSRPFSDKEAQEIKQPLVDALADYFTYTDEFIYATHKAHNHVDIWKTIDYEEMNILVDAWLSRAKRDAKAASGIVTLVNSHYKLKVGIILAPRFYQTFNVYMASGIGLK